MATDSYEGIQYGSVPFSSNDAMCRKKSEENALYPLERQQRRQVYNTVQWPDLEDPNHLAATHLSVTLPAWSFNRILTCSALARCRRSLPRR